MVVRRVPSINKPSEAGDECSYDRGQVPSVEGNVGARRPVKGRCGRRGLALYEGLDAGLTASRADLQVVALVRERLVAPLAALDLRNLEFGEFIVKELFEFFFHLQCPHSGPCPFSL